MKKQVMIVTGAGQIGMAIARRMGYGKKVILGDKNPEQRQRMARMMNEAGFDAAALELDLEELGRKAKFSQHKLTEEERAAAWRCAAHAAEAWRNGLRLGRKKKGG